MANIEIRDGANSTKYLKATGAGSDIDPHIPEQIINQTNAGKPWLLQVSDGDISGWSLVHKFGEATVGTTLQPVTDSGNFLTAQTAQSLEIVSSDAADNAAGNGAREVTVIGLDSNWDEVTQTVIPNGTTPVALSTNLTRIYRAYVSSSGTYATQSAGSHTGTLTIRDSGGAGSDWIILSTSPFPIGQSEVGVYTIPDGKTAWILSEHIIVDASKSVDAYFFRRDNADDITSPYSGSMRIINKFIGLSGEIDYRPKAPVNGLVGPCDIGFMALTSTGTAGISVDFEVLLKDTV